MDSFHQMKIASGGEDSFDDSIVLSNYSPSLLPPKLTESMTAVADHAARHRMIAQAQRQRLYHGDREGNASLDLFCSLAELWAPLALGVDHDHYHIHTLPLDRVTHVARGRLDR